MNLSNRHYTLGSLAAVLLLSSPVWGEQTDRSPAARLYQVTITNVTRAQVFTPIVAASHRGKVTVFELGQPASAELEQLAEGGDTAPLAAKLKAQGARDVVSSGEALPPGGTVMLKVRGSARHNRVSVAAMLIPTNDTFFAVTDVQTRPPGRSVNLWVPGYDAGTEPNTELCSQIPGPVCGGEGFNPEAGEGYVYVNQGIQGIGDLAGAPYDWRNPVAKVTIKTLR